MLSDLFVDRLCVLSPLSSEFVKLSVELADLTLEDFEVLIAQLGYFLDNIFILTGNFLLRLELLSHFIDVFLSLLLLCNVSFICVLQLIDLGFHCFKGFDVAFDFLFFLLLEFLDVEIGIVFGLLVGSFWRRLAL